MTFKIVILFSVLFGTNFVFEARSGLFRVEPSMLNVRLKNANGINIYVAFEMCADLCVRITGCLSLNYHHTSQHCELFNVVASTSDPLITAPGYFHINITAWKGIRPGPCNEATCRSSEICLPSNQSPVCTDIINAPGKVVIPALRRTTSSPTPSPTSPPTTREHVTTESSTMEALTCPYNVLEHPDIGDGAVTASSTKSNASLHNDYYAPYWARLSTTANDTLHGGGWMAGTTDQNQYIQVTFPEVYRLYAVFIRAYHGETAWVKTFRVEHSMDCDQYTTFKDPFGNIATLTGNENDNSLFANFFSPSFITKCFRINPRTWHNNIGLRFELLGCEEPS